MSKAFPQSKSDRSSMRESRQNNHEFLSPMVDRFHFKARVDQLSQIGRKVQGRVTGHHDSWGEGGGFGGQQRGQGPRPHGPCIPSEDVAASFHPCLCAWPRSPCRSQPIPRNPPLPKNVPSQNPSRGKKYAKTVDSMSLFDYCRASTACLIGSAFHSPPRDSSRVQYVAYAEPELVTPGCRGHGLGGVTRD